jgi:hypothetical protein
VRACGEIATRAHIQVRGLGGHPLEAGSFKEGGAAPKCEPGDGSWET